MPPCAAAVLRAVAPALRARRRASWTPRGAAHPRARAASAAALPPPPPAPLAAGEVHLWWMDTRAPPAPALLEAYAALLSPAELAAVRSGDDVAEGVRTERLLSRALARVTLARYVRAPPAALRFGRNAHGKPWLAPPDGGAAPRFSIAHAPGALLCAVAASGELGCDVEAAARGSGVAAERLSRRYYSAPERAALEALPPGEPRRRRFLELWTLKEAYVKALGRGIAAAPLDSFALHLAPPPQDNENDAAAPMRVQLAHGAAGPLLSAPRGDGSDDSAEPASWRFALLSLRSAADGDGDGDGHLAAVCAAASPGGGDAPLALRCWRTVPLGGADEEYRPTLLAFGR